MDHSTASIAAFLADEDGVTAIEYGLLAALITVVAIAGMTAMSDSVVAAYERWTSAVIAAIGGS